MQDRLDTASFNNRFLIQRRGYTFTATRWNVNRVALDTDTNVGFIYCNDVEQNRRRLQNKAGFNANPLATWDVDMKHVAAGELAFNVFRLETSNRIWLVDPVTGDNFLATKIINHGAFSDEIVLAAYTAAWDEPTQQPSEQPTEQPSEQPTEKPTEQPSEQPTQQPTEQPTIQPTQQPTEQPTIQPTFQPTEQPTQVCCIYYFFVFILCSDFSVA